MKLEINFKMNKISKCLIIWAILIIIISGIILNQSKTSAYAGSLSGQIVIEKTSKRVLYESRASDKMEMASTTKILTAITVIENSNLNDIVVIPKIAVGVEGSSIYLKEGESLSVLDLLYGLMLRSGNDAAVALALHVSGSIDEFAGLMNKTAKECGARNSNFTNPHGLHDDNHYTTCYDLALITAHALENETFSKICSTKKIKCGERVFVNKNKMLKSFEDCDGVKTGYTVNAGRCLVTSATRNGMQLISVVLNCYDMYERSAQILNDCFSKFELCKVLEKDCVLSQIPLSNGMTDNEKYSVILNEDLYLPLTKNELYNLNYSFNNVKSLNFPIKKGEYVGDLSVFTGKDLIFSSKLYTILQVNEYNIEQIIKGIFVRW